MEYTKIVNKYDLATDIFENMKEAGRPIAKGDIKDIIDEFINGIKQTLLDGGAVKIVNFANFELSHIPERQYEDHFHDGGTYIIPEHDVIKIRPSKAWNYKVSGLRDDK